MKNVNEFHSALLAAFGDTTTDVSNIHKFHEAIVAAVTAGPAGGASIVALGGTITGATANDTMTAVADIALSTSDTYTDAAVNAAVNAAVAEVEDNLADLQAKVNELITQANS